MASSDTPTRLRLFVAVEVPDQIRMLIARTQEQLRRSVPHALIKWITPEQFHITLQFLGDIEAGRLAELFLALAAACSRCAVFELAAQGVGFFPDARRPRVVWVGTCDQNQGLGELARAVQTGTLRFGRKPEERKFSGHITLGRIKGIARTEAEKLARVAAGFSASEFGRWTVSRVLLVRSELRSHGSVYTYEQQFGLSNRRAGWEVR